MIARTTNGRVLYIRSDGNEDGNFFLSIFVLYSFQRTTKVSCYKYLHRIEENQKYHITFLCKKNESIILHHVLPNSPENVFLVAFLMLKL